MAVLDLLEQRLQRAAEPLREAEPEHLRDRVRRQAQEADVAGALEQLVDRPVATHDQIPAVLDLLERVVPRQVGRGAVARRELRTHGPGPVLQPLPNDGRAEPVRRRLQRQRVRRGEKRIVVFAEAEAEAQQFPLDEVMAVEVVRDVERQKGPHAQQHRAQHVVADVEVVMRVSATLWGDEAVVRVRGGELGRAELARFCSSAMGSASELEYHLLLAKDLALINVKDHEELALRATELKRMLTALLQKLNADR